MELKDVSNILYSEVQRFINDIQAVKERNDLSKLEKQYNFYMYYLTLLRAILNTFILIKTELKLLASVDDMETQELINVYKATARYYKDVLTVHMRFIPQTELDSEKLKELEQEFEKYKDENAGILIRKILEHHIKELSKMALSYINEIKNYKPASYLRWKHEQSFITMLDKLYEAVKLYDSLGEEEIQEEVLMSLEDALLLLEQCKKDYEVMEQEVDENFKKMQLVKAGLSKDNQNEKDEDEEDLDE